jgi:CDP-diacylglycerol--serine O-phosphatidyltransferase
MNHALPTDDRCSRLFTLANMITLGSLAASLTAVMQAFDHHFEWVGPLFLLATICDGLDGFVARKRHTAGPLGMQLDSLIDMVSFGVVPPLVAYAYLTDCGTTLPFWMIGTYVACTAIRLVRFNLQADKSFFNGLNSPSAASLVLFLVWSLDTAFGANPDRQYTVALEATLIFAAVMMVSPFRYISTKQLKPTKRLSNQALALAIAALVLGTAPYSLWVCAALYALSGPSAALVSRVRTNR